MLYYKEQFVTLQKTTVYQSQCPVVLRLLPPQWSSFLPWWLCSHRPPCHTHLDEYDQQKPAIQWSKMCLVITGLIPRSHGYQSHSQISWLSVSFPNSFHNFMVITSLIPRPHGNETKIYNYYLISFQLSFHINIQCLKPSSGKTKKQSLNVAQLWASSHSISSSTL